MGELKAFVILVGNLVGLLARIPRLDYILALSVRLVPLLLKTLYINIVP